MCRLQNNFGEKSRYFLNLLTQRHLKTENSLAQHENSLAQPENSLYPKKNLRKVTESFNISIFIVSTYYNSLQHSDIHTCI